MPKALKIIPANFSIIAQVSNVSPDELNDAYEYYYENGECAYQIIDGTHDDNNFTTTTVSESGLNQSYKFNEPESISTFTEITRK